MVHQFHRDHKNSVDEYIKHLCDSCRGRHNILVCITFVTSNSVFLIEYLFCAHFQVMHYHPRLDMDRIAVELHKQNWDVQLTLKHMEEVYASTRRVCD